MNRKTLRKQQRAQVHAVRRSMRASERRSFVTAGAVVASAMFTGLSPATAIASESMSPRLTLIHRELSPQPAVVRDVLRLGRTGSSAAPGYFVDQGVGSVGGVAQDGRVLRFNIAAGPLDGALAEFERVTGIKVVLGNPGIGTVQSPGVAGALTPARAVEALLTGTSVRATFGANAVRLDVRGVSEFVAVDSAAPKMSSPKYRAPILDTPQTVVVIPQQVFQEQGVTSLREVLRNTPGITMSIGEGNSGLTSAGDNVMIRGFSARNDIFIDGARDPGELSRDTFNSESIEVAKGPSSVTGGRGSTGGSINLVTKSANLLDSMAVRATGGSSEYGRATVDVNRRLGKTVAFRMNGMWQDAGYPGRDIAKNRAWGLAPSLAVGLGTPTKLTLNYSRLQQNNIPDWGIPTLLPDNAIAQGITVNDLNFSNWYGIASRDHEKTTADVATAIVDHKFSKTFSLRNLTRYGKNYRDAVLTPPRPTAAVAGQGPEDPGYNPAVPQLRRTDTKYQRRNDRMAANQTDLTTVFRTGPIGHNADIGVEIARDHQPTYAIADLFTNGRPPVDDLFNPTPNAEYTPALAPTGASSDAHAASAAAYVFDTVKLSDRWQADLGVRWDRVKIDYTSVAVTGVATNFGRTDRAASGRAGLLFKPMAEASIYAAVSTSFTPSYDGAHGLTLAATGASSQALPPEKSRDIEIGAKWEVAHELQLTAAVFDIQKTNAKTVDLAGATVLAGNQHVKGVELGMSGNLTQRWAAFGGLSLMDGTVKDSGVPSEIGQQLAYVPRVSFNLWSTYRLPMNLTLGGSANYSDGNYFNQTGGYLLVSNRLDPRYVQNAAAIQALTKYWVFNAVAIYPLNKHIQLQLNVTNLGNEKYSDRGYDRHFLPGQTRQVLLSPVITF